MSDIKRIVANLEYIHPKGELENYKYGIKVNPPQGTTPHEPQSIIQGPSIKEMKAEMSKSPLKPKANFEIVGDE